MLQPHRLRAPKQDGAILAEPPLREAARLLAGNRDHLSRWDHDFQGRRAARLRAMARVQVLRSAAEYLGGIGLGESFARDPAGPLIVTGHQPELFHPGVWIKNFAAAAIAKEHGGLALNLIVDNDIPKGAGLRVPTSEGGRLRGAPVDFDVWSGEVPYEDWSVTSEEAFAGFGRRVRRTLDGLIPDPMVDEAWPLAMQARTATDRIGLRFSAMRRRLEAGLGVRNAEVPLSVVCETEAFGWFASHLLAHLPRFQATHNAALARYRALYKIRSKNHPVPRLDREGEWLEAPFWAWRAENPRRRPLLARQNDQTMDLRIAGEDEPFGTLPLSMDRDACCAVEELANIAGRKIRIRTRALTTTMFARLILGDLFIHGIGGAKYDELGDEVIRGFFGVAPPDYLTLSMTLWPGLDADTSASSRLKANDRALRDLRYNPDRLLLGSTDPDVASLIRRKRLALEGPVTTRRDRVARFREIRRCNEALSEYVAESRDRAEAERKDLREVSRRNTVAMGRDWSFLVHSRSRLVAAIEAAIPSFGET